MDVNQIINVGFAAAVAWYLLGKQTEALNALREAIQALALRIEHCPVAKDEEK